MCYGALDGLRCLNIARSSYRGLKVRVLSFVRKLDLRSVLQDDAGERRRWTMRSPPCAASSASSEGREEVGGSLPRHRLQQPTSSRKSSVSLSRRRRVTLETARAERRRPWMSSGPRQRGLDDVKPLIRRLRGQQRRGVRLRSMMGTRLRSIMDTIMVAPHSGGRR